MSSGNSIPKKGYSREPHTAELHVLCVGNSFPACLCHQQSPSWWHLPFPTVMLLRVFVGSVLHQLKPLYSLQWVQFWPSEKAWLHFEVYLTIQRLPSLRYVVHPPTALTWDLLWLLFLFYFNLRPYRPLLFSLIHHLLPKFLCPVTHIIFFLLSHASNCIFLAIAQKFTWGLFLRTLLWTLFKKIKIIITIHSIY